MDTYLGEKWNEFLLQNNKEIISSDVVTNLRRRVTLRETELEKLREKVKEAHAKLNNSVCKLKYEKLESTVRDLKIQLEAAKKTISDENTMKLDKEVKELRKKDSDAKKREVSLHKEKHDLLCINKSLENELKNAKEATMTQVKFNEKISSEKEQQDKQFKTERIATRWEIVALKEEKERLTMEQYKFLAFVREIVNTSGFQGYQSDDAHTVCGQLDRIANYVKSEFEKLRQDINIINELELVNQHIGLFEENPGACSQENVGTNAESNNHGSHAHLSTLGNRLPSSASPSSDRRRPSIVNELRSSSEPSSQLPQQNRFEARSSVTNNRKRNSNNGLKRIQREILKKKKHFMWTTKKGGGSGSVEGRWWCDCGIAFKRKLALTNHIRYYSLDWKFQCEKCPEIFRYLCQLKAHLRKFHKMPNPFNGSTGCSICGQIFPNKRELIRHTISVCTSGLGNESPRQLSYRSALLNTPVNRSSRSSSSSTTGTVVVSESESDSNGNENSARPLASSGVLHKTMLNRSERKDALGRIHREVAIVNGNETDNSSIDGNPNDKENKRSRLSWRCECGSEYPNRYSLQHHIRLMVFGNTLECIRCFHRVPNFSFLKKHMAKKHGILDYTGSVGCNLCGSQFASMVCYKNHFEEFEDEHRVQE